MFILILLLHFAETANCDRTRETILYYCRFGILSLRLEWVLGVCVYIFSSVTTTRLSSHHFKAISSHWGLQDFSNSGTVSSLENSMGDTWVVGALQAFPSEVQTTDTNCPSHHGWVAGPVYSSGWICFLSHFDFSRMGAPVVVSFSFWHRLESQCCFVCKFCTLWLNMEDFSLYMNADHLSPVKA